VLSGADAVDVMSRNGMGIKVPKLNGSNRGGIWVGQLKDVIFKSLILTLSRRTGAIVEYFGGEVLLEHACR
jgi:hypothetical protein